MMNDNRVSTTSARLKEIIKERKKKQVQLATETGIDKGSISNYIAGRYEPKQDAIYKLAKALDVSEMWLFGYNVPKERTSTQKKNDDLVEIIAKLRSDSELCNVVKKLTELNESQYESIKQLLSAFIPE